MKIYSTTLLSCFPNTFTPYYNQDADYLFDFHSIIFWNRTCNDKNISQKLIIIYASELETLNKSVEQALQLIIINDTKEPLILLPDNIHYIMLNHSADPISVYNCMEPFLSQTARNILDFDYVVRQIMCNNIADALNAFSDNLHTPLALLDENMGVLYITQYNTPAFPEFRQNLQSGYYCDYGIQALIQKNGATVRNTKTKKVVPLQMSSEGAVELFYPLLIGERERKSGFLYCFFENKTEAYNSVSYLSFLSKLLEKKLWQDISFGPIKQNSFISYALKLLIDNVEKNKHIIDNIFARYNFKWKKYKQLMAVIPENSWNNNSFVYQPNLIHIEKYILDIMPESLSCSYDGFLVVLLQSDESELLSDKKYYELNNLLKDNACYAGISNPIESIDEYIKNYYERALAAAIASGMIQSSSRIQYYKSAALYHLVLNLTLKSGPDAGLRNALRYLIDPGLLKLAALDKDQNYEYLKTLQYYWYFGKDVTKICDYMHIHRSTFFYRLNKIKKILNCDISEYDNLLQLSIGLKLMEVMKLIEHEEFPKR